MDASLAIYLMAALGADMPILEALDASFNALNPLDYFKSKLLAIFKIDLDSWGPMEPGTANGYPLNLQHTEVLHVIYNITQEGPHYLVRAHTNLGVATLLVTLNTPHSQINKFLQELRLLAPHYRP